MDVEYNVTGKIHVNNMESFQERIQSVPFVPVNALRSGEKLEYEFNLDGFAYLILISQDAMNSNCEGLSAEIRLKNTFFQDKGVNAAEMMDESRLKSVCKFLSEAFQSEASMGRCSEYYGNCNVFNGGSDYEVIEEKWFTCVYDKGELVEEKRFSK